MNEKTSLAELVARASAKLKEVREERPHWFIIIANGVLTWRCTDGSHGSDPFDSQGFERVMALIGNGTWEVRYD